MIDVNLLPRELTGYVGYVCWQWFERHFSRDEVPYIRGGVSAGVVGLKNIRKARRLTQVELAGLSGIARPSISRFETNGRPVSQMYLRTALRLSEALQCDPVDFLTEGY